MCVSVCLSARVGTPHLSTTQSVQYVCAICVCVCVSLAPKPKPVCVKHVCQVTGVFVTVCVCVCVCNCHRNCTDLSCVCTCVCECMCVSFRSVCVRVPDCVSVLCWNVCTLGGSKLRDPAFHATFARADFVFFTETRVLASDLFLPGFVCENYPHTPADTQSPITTTGGVAFCVRTGLQHTVRDKHLFAPSMLHVHVDGRAAGFDRDVHFVCVYMLHASSQQRDPMAWLQLSAKLQSLPKEHHIMLLGDFNAPDLSPHLLQTSHLIFPPICLSMTPCRTCLQVCVCGQVRTSVLMSTALTCWMCVRL